MLDAHSDLKTYCRDQFISTSIALQGLNYLHLVRKYSDNENRVQKRKELSSEATEDEAEDEEQEVDEDRSDEEDAKIQKVDTNEEKEEAANENEQEAAQIGQCAICHIIINDANLGGSVADSEQEPRCSEGYLLCQRCVRNFSIRSGR